MKCRYMYVYTRIIFVAVLSPTIKIFHRHLGPSLYIFAVKFSPWFHWHFTVILWHITDISPRKNTDQGDFLLKCAVRAVCLTMLFGGSHLGFLIDTKVYIFYENHSWNFQVMIAFKWFGGLRRIFLKPFFFIWSHVKLCHVVASILDFQSPKICLILQGTIQWLFTCSMG